MTIVCVRAVRGGSDAAFEVLYERHHRALLAFCRHMLGTREEAEDAIQSTFLAAYHDLRTDDERPIHLQPWLFTIARHRCLRVLRARRPRAEADLEQHPVATEGLGEQVQRRADLRELLADVGRLPEDQRAALLLAELHAMSHRDIAAVLDVPAQKVKALVFQARSSLIASRSARAVPCSEVRAQLGELTGGSLRRRELQRHLRDCPGCTEFRAQLRRQKAMFAAALPVVPTAGLRAAVFGTTTGGAGGAGGGAAGRRGGGAEGRGGQARARGRRDGGAGRRRRGRQRRDLRPVHRPPRPCGRARVRASRASRAAAGRRRRPRRSGHRRPRGRGGEPRTRGAAQHAHRVVAAVTTATPHAPSPPGFGDRPERRHALARPGRGGGREPGRRWRTGAQGGTGRGAEGEQPARARDVQNGNGNANANGQGNGNANGQGNGNAYGQGNGNSNGAANGNGNASTPASAAPQAQQSEATQQQQPPGQQNVPPGQAKQSGNHGNGAGASANANGG